MEKYALIVAGGTGIRMKSGIPKQFLEISGIPIIMHTIRAFVRAIPSIRLVVVLPDDHIPVWESLTGTHRFDIPHQLVSGGKERFHSVKNGLALVPDRSLVAIHDGVRPVVPPSLIMKGFRAAERFGSAIPCIPVRESVRIMEGNTHRPFPRDILRVIQTPQTFRSQVIKQVYNQPFHETFTDDASVLESMGQPVHLIPGEPVNIKITYPEDLMIAEILLKNLQMNH